MFFRDSLSRDPPFHIQATHPAEPFRPRNPLPREVVTLRKSRKPGRCPPPRGSPPSPQSKGRRPPRARSCSTAQSQMLPPRGLASVDVLNLVLARLRHLETPVLIRVGARQPFLLVPDEVDGLCPPSEWRPSCGALLLHPSCFCFHPRCLFSNISPTEGRGCCPGKDAVTPKVSVTKEMPPSPCQPP